MPFLDFFAQKLVHFLLGSHITPASYFSIKQVLTKVEMETGYFVSLQGGKGCKCVVFTFQLLCHLLLQMLQSIGYSTKPEQKVNSFWEFWEWYLNAAAPKNRANYKDTQSLRTCLPKPQNTLSEPLKLLFQVSSLSIDHEVLFIKVQSLKIILPMNIANEASRKKPGPSLFVRVGLN